MKKPISFVIALLILTTLACGFNVSTAKISDAKLAKDADGNQPTTTFSQDEPFYCVVELANAPDDTKVKAVWTAVEAEGVQPNLALGDKELTTGDGQLNFNYTNEAGKLWPTGKYKVDLYLNDKLDRSLEFQVEALAAAVEPTPTTEPTATAEPTAEPTEELTAEPTEEVTEEASAEPTQENAIGDVLQLPTAEATAEAETLPFKEEPYVHPSNAFSLALPESFEDVANDETSASFGNDDSRLAVEFVNTGKTFSDKEMNTFINEVVKIVMDNFAADDYKVLEQKTTSNGNIFVAVSYESANGDGDADLVFTQQDNIVFVLYFISVVYSDMEPTWQKIIASYTVDADAALAAAPTPTPAAPAPAPKPTEPPAPAGPSIPAGKGLYTYSNGTDVDFVVDVIGPTNASQVVPPGQTKEFILDPGHYNINAHSAGGKYYVPSYEFDIAAGQFLQDGVQ